KDRVTRKHRRPVEGLKRRAGRGSGCRHSERTGHDGMLLGRMQSCIADRSRRRRRTPRVFERYTRRQRGFQWLAKKMPGAVILCFFLSPDQFPQPRKAAQLGGKRIGGKRIELL